MEPYERYINTESSRIFKDIDEEDFESKYDKKKIFLGLRRHLLIIFLPALLFGALGGIYTWDNLTNYRATALLLYTEDIVKGTDIKEFNISELTLPTTVELIITPAHLDALISILGLDMTPDELEEHLIVPTPRRSSAVVEVTATADNPNLAIDIANTLARISVRTSKEHLQSQYHKALNTFQKEIEEVKKKLGQENKEIENFKMKNLYLEMGADYKMIINDMLSAKEQLEKARVEYDSLLVQYENIKRGMGNLPENVAIGIESAQSPVSSQILQLRAELSDARARYTESNPKVIRLKKQLDALTGKEEEDEMAKEGPDITFQEKPQTNLDLMRMQATVRAAQKRVQYLEERLADIQEAIKDVPTEQMKLSKFLSDKAATEKRLEKLNENFNTIMLKLNSPEGNLQLYLSAEKAEPKSTKRLVYLMPFIGFVFGLIFGTLAAFLLELIDAKLRTKKQIEISYKTPIFSVIPLITQIKRRNREKKFLTFSRQLSDRLLIVEQKLKEQNKIQKNKGFITAFISCENGAGKSSLSAELRNYYIKIGKRVVLLELDPHNGSETHLATEIPSLYSYFQGEVTLSEMRSKEPLSIIKLGNITTNITEKIKSNIFSDLIHQLENEYDYIIIDAPAILREEYGAYLGGLADALIMIIESSQDVKKQVDAVFEELESLDIIPSGIVLNKVLKHYIDNEKLLRELKAINKL